LHSETGGAYLRGSDVIDRLYRHEETVRTGVHEDQGIRSAKY
jgi:hypothetical protein